MVGVAERLRHLVVAQENEGSNPSVHPNSDRFEERARLGAAPPSRAVFLSRPALNPATESLPAQTPPAEVSP